MEKSAPLSQRELEEAISEPSFWASSSFPGGEIRTNVPLERHTTVTSVRRTRRDVENCK